MSAPPFFQSAGRGDLKFWGEDDGPTVVVWESLSESEQEQREIMLFIGNPMGRSIVISNATNPLKESRKRISIEVCG